VEQATKCADPSDERRLSACHNTDGPKPDEDEAGRCPICCEYYSEWHEEKRAPCGHVCCDCCWARVIWRGGACPMCRAGVGDWIQKECADVIHAPPDAVDVREICAYIAATLHEHPRQPRNRAEALKNTDVRAYVRATMPNDGFLRELAMRILRHVPAGSVAQVPAAPVSLGPPRPESR